MDAQKSQNNRTLLIVMALLYLLIIAFFSYMEWQAAPDSGDWWKYLLNIPILSIPLVLLFGSIYMLVSANQQRKTAIGIEPRLKRLIHIAARIASGMIIFFVGLFSLDVFGTGAPLLEQIGGFLIHSLPSISMLILLAFAWKRPVIGFYSFLFAALVFLVMFVRDVDALGNLVLFVLPLLMVALLFYADWKWLNSQNPEEMKI